MVSVPVIRPVIRGWMIALLLMGAGAFFVWKFPENHFVWGLAEALIIAGLLALVVDPYLKRDLLKEASRGIFVHLLGFEHRAEVKEKLKQLVFETKLLRKSLDLRCTVEERSQDGFDLTVEYDTEYINPTHSALDLTPSMEFDKAHKVEVIQMTFTSSDGKYKWNGKPDPKEKEPGVETATGKTFAIQPESMGITYKAYCKYKILLRHGYSQFHAGRPTLRTTLHATVPSGYEVRASSATVENLNYWQYDSIQMVGDHITLRWRKRDGEWV